ncbi:hypothetical protein C665_12151 [Thauera aminoaromatica S2]|uniref:Uncharacterized protein n=1 Tax=Thauera aminoaromatica S2 TaxID=1234381 RepID=N6XSR2_THASP|nr:hypothetical protein C665_12151 [Thauera aminoaromatica S2]
MLSQEEQGRGGGTQEFEIPVTVRCRVRGKGDQAIAGVEVIDAFRIGKGQILSQARHVLAVCPQLIEEHRMEPYDS